MPDVVTIMPKQAPTPLTRAEIDSILQHARATDAFDYMFLRVLRKCGRRLGELYGLYIKREHKWKYGVIVQDFDFNTNSFETFILKRRSYRRKLAFLDPGTMLLIQRHIKKYKLGPEDHIFRRKSYRALQRLPAKYAKMAGIKKCVMCHSFRHFFITYCKSRGMPYEDIQKLTGHSSLASLSTYDHSDIFIIEKQARSIVANV